MKDITEFKTIDGLKRRRSNIMKQKLRLDNELWELDTTLTALMTHEAEIQELLAVGKTPLEISHTLNVRHKYVQMIETANQGRAARSEGKKKLYEQKFRERVAAMRFVAHAHKWSTSAQNFPTFYARYSGIPINTVRKMLEKENT